MQQTQTETVKKLNDRFSVLQRTVEELRDALLSTAPAAHAADSERIVSESETRSLRVVRAREMLATRGTIVVADLMREMNISHATAGKILHQISRLHGAVLQLEPMGPTHRLRLWHPDRVVFDWGVSSPS